MLRWLRHNRLHDRRHAPNSQNATAQAQSANQNNVVAATALNQDKYNHQARRPETALPCLWENQIDYANDTE